MSLTQLLKKNKVLSEKEIEKMVYFFENITPNTNNIITVSRIADYTDISYDKILKVVELLVENEFLSFRYGIRCPDCGLLIEDYETLEDVQQHCPINCYNCDYDVPYDKENVVLLFSISNSNSFFELGQHGNNEKVEMCNVAREDALDKIEKFSPDFIEIIEKAAKITIKNEKKKKSKLYKIASISFGIFMAVCCVYFLCAGNDFAFFISLVFSLISYILTNIYE